MSDTLKQSGGVKRHREEDEKENKENGNGASQALDTSLEDFQSHLVRFTEGELVFDCSDLMLMEAPRERNERIAILARSLTGLCSLMQSICQKLEKQNNPVTEKDLMAYFSYHLVGKSPQEIENLSGTGKLDLKSAFKTMYFWEEEPLGLLIGRVAKHWLNHVMKDEDMSLWTLSTDGPYKTIPEALVNQTIEIVDKSIVVTLLSDYGKSDIIEEMFREKVTEILDQSRVDKEKLAAVAPIPEAN